MRSRIWRIMALPVIPFRLGKSSQVDRADNIGTAAGATDTTATRQHGLGVDEACPESADFALGFLTSRFIDLAEKFPAAQYRDLEELGSASEKYRAQPNLP